jgi:hypothetical protein
MSRFHFVVSVAVLVAASFLIYALGVTLNYSRYSNDVVEELMYFPSGRLLGIASLGYDTVLADLLWLRGIQYYGEHRRTDRNYPLAEHVFKTITDLDPAFVDAYRFGAFVLGQDAGQPVSGAHLLKKGMRHNPYDWRLPFDLGFLHFIVMKDGAAAGHYFKMASRIDGSPALAKRFSAFAYRKAGKTAVAKALWEEIHSSSDNKVMKETAEYALRSILRDEIRDSLDVCIDRFHKLRGRPPGALDELVRAGLVKGIPEDPLGGRYFIDPASGVAMSSSEVRENAEHSKLYLERLLRRYRDQTGTFPETLADLERSGIVAEVPQVAGARRVYKQDEGTVDYFVIGEEEE